PFCSARTDHFLYLHSVPTRRSSDLLHACAIPDAGGPVARPARPLAGTWQGQNFRPCRHRSRPQDRSRAVLRLEPTSLAALKSTTDRKSTRLNSSHVKISYAVFCLKK